MLLANDSRRFGGAPALPTSRATSTQNWCALRLVSVQQSQEAVFRDALEIPVRGE